ncbi:MAG TPA: fasciclin domain-containing protein [Pseudonocardiaceae bacterium]|nr:fasciclin domain-containing protein [Pseudonocardiaceae bacterium]
MVNDPVGTAASHNPLLSTLTKAATAANLVDTLNSAPAITVFAPTDPAFAALETQHPGITKQLTTAPDVASPNSQLAKILTYHVIGQRYDATGLISAGTLTSLEGAKLTIGGTAAAPTVNGAPVLCGNIPTKNATVFVIGAGAVPACVLRRSTQYHCFPGAAREGSRPCWCVGATLDLSLTQYDHLRSAGASRLSGLRNAHAGGAEGRV